MTPSKRGARKSPPASAPKSGRSRAGSSRSQAVTVPELRIGSAGKVVKNATLRPVPGDRARRYYVYDARGRQVKGADKLPLTASRRDQQRATAAAKSGGGLVSPESRAAGVRAMYAGFLIESGDTQAMDLARRFALRQSATTGRKMTIEEAMTDPRFLKHLAYLSGNHKKRRGKRLVHGPRSQYATALVELGLRDPSADYHVGESPEGSSGKVIRRIEKAAQTRLNLTYPQYPGPK